MGCISSPAQGYFWALTCFTTYQPARPATESLMLQWYQRTRRASGRIWPCGNNRTCSIIFPSSQLYSWHLQTQLSWPSLWWFYTSQSAYPCVLGNTDFKIDHCGNKAKQSSPLSPRSETLFVAVISAGSQKICGRTVVCAESLRKALCLKYRHRNCFCAVADHTLFWPGAVRHFRQAEISPLAYAEARFLSREGSSSYHTSNKLRGWEFTEVTRKTRKSISSPFIPGQ